MTLAMERNEVYIKQVQFDLEHHKYSLVVSENLVPWGKSITPNLIDRDSYENDVWVNFDAIPVLDYNRPIHNNKKIGIAIYAPKE